MDPFLIVVVLGGAVSLAGPLALIYQNYLLRHSSKRAIRLEEKGETEKAIRYLKWTLYCLSRQPAEVRIHPHMTLGTLYLRSQRFAEGEAHLRTALAACHRRGKLTVDSTTEAQIRSNIAIALESQGDTVGAAAERDLASHCLLNEKNRNYSWHFLRASDLQTRMQYSEAVQEYKTGLKKLPSSYPASLRGQEIIALASCLSGWEHTTEALSCWKQALDGSLPSDILSKVYFMTGMECHKLNRFEDAEHYYTAAIEADNHKALGGRVRGAIIRWQIAETQLMRGNLQNARQLLNHYLDSVDMKNSPATELLACDIDTVEGSFRDAKNRAKHLQQSIDSGSFDSDWREMLPGFKTSLCLRLVGLHILLNEPKNALAEVENLRLENDEVLKWCYEAFCVTAQAQLETKKECRAALEAQVIDIKQRIENDFARRLDEGAEVDDAAAVLRQPTNFLAYAALTLKMYDTCLQLYKRNLEMNSSPVNLPGVHCFIGECHAALGNPQDARIAWQNAVTSGIDTYYARIASQHLTKHQAAVKGTVKLN
ncbi:MAG: hypothetical protein V4671_32450 [Armatimonadota bacterium]